jgi:hypothetical protein
LAKGDDSNEPKPLVTQHVVNLGVLALARETGYTAATVSTRLKKGHTPDQIRADAKRKGLTARAHGPLAKRKRGSRGPGTPPNGKTEYDLVIESRNRGDALEQAKLRRAEALAERQEIENMLRRGELVPVAYMRTWGVRFLVAARDELLKGPSELADALAAEDDPLKTGAVLRGWVDRTIAKFEQLEELWKGSLEESQVA